MTGPVDLAPLDRQVWNMLHGRLAEHAQGTALARRIAPELGPFAAARDWSEEALAALGGLFAGPDDRLWLVETEAWPAPPGCHVEHRREVLQMVADGPALPDCEDAEIVALGEAEAAEMSALALATKPGPWASQTHRYGHFFGIRREGRLAAMAGERMLPAPRLAEISGVCTWPEYRGQGLARRLIAQVMAGQRARGEVPYLHSYSDNPGAIGLYESLGFRPRRTLVVTILARN